MASSINARVVSGVRKRKYQFTWKIKNFYEVQQSEKLVNAQQFQITTDVLSDFETRWTLGLKVKKLGHGFGRSYIHPYWKLTYGGSGFQCFDDNAVPVITGISLVNENGTQICNNLKRFSGRLNQINMGDALCIFNDGQYNSNLWEDDDGTITLNLTLTILVPVTFSRPRSQSM